MLLGELARQNLKGGALRGINANNGCDDHLAKQEVESEIQRPEHRPKGADMAYTQGNYKIDVYRYTLNNGYREEKIVADFKPGLMEKVEASLNSPANWRIILKLTGLIVAVSIVTMLIKNFGG